MAGWHLIMTMAMYQATGDRFYLNAAKIIVHRLLDGQSQDGGWDFYRACAHPDPPFHFGIIGFMVGVLLTGLVAVHEANGDEVIADAIVRGGRCLVDRLWTPETRTFRDLSCPKLAAGRVPDLTFLMLPGVAFAHQRTGDARLAQVLVAATEKTLTGIGGNQG